MNEKEYIDKYCKYCANKDKDICNITRDLRNNAKCVNYEKYDFIPDRDLLINIRFNELNLIISKVILEYRDRHNLTRHQLANLLHKNEKYIANIEQTGGNLSINELNYLVGHLEKDFEYSFIDKLAHFVMNCNTELKNENYVRTSVIREKIEKISKIKTITDSQKIAIDYAISILQDLLEGEIENG